MNTATTITGLGNYDPEVYKTETQWRSNVAPLPQQPNYRTRRAIRRATGGFKDRCHGCGKALSLFRGATAAVVGRAPDPAGPVG